MKINCLFCGFQIDLDEAYSDYEGQIKCYTCKSVLEIKVDNGMLKMVKLAEAAPVKKK
jgi:hypothetical protein